MLVPGLAAAVAFAAVLSAAGGAAGPIAEGLPDPGTLARWGAPATRLLVDLSAVMTVGALLIVAVLLPTERADTSVIGSHSRARAWASSWACLWSVAALACAVLTASEVTGIPLAHLPMDQLVTAIFVVSSTRALLLVAVIAALLVSCSLASHSRAGDRATLGVALMALTPLVYAGHSAHDGGHPIATGVQVVHVIAATTWLGGLAGVCAYTRRHRDLPQVASRFSTLALVCFVVVVLSGALSALARLGVSRENWWSAFGAVLGVKAVAALALGLIGWTHRRATLVRLRAGRANAFARLAAVELAVMGATMGVAVALTRTPTPGDGAVLERATRSVGPGIVAPYTLGNLVHDWRPEPVLSSITVLLLIACLRALPAVRHGRRAASAVGAAVVALLALGLPTSYDGRPLVAVQSTQFLLLALLVPTLIVSAGTTTSAADGRPRWREWVEDPTAGFVVLVAAAVAAQQHSVQMLAITSPAAHVVMLAAPLVAGTLFIRSLAGKEVGSRSLGAAVIPAAAVVFLVGFGFVLASNVQRANSAGASALAQLTAEARFAALAFWCAALALALVAGARLAEQHRAARRI